MDMVATPARSPAGNTTRHSLELNGPMMASTLSSSASLRRPTTAWSGLPAVSNDDDAKLLAGDAAGGVDLVDGDLRGDLVGLRERRERPGARGQVAEQDAPGRLRSRPTARPALPPRRRRSISSSWCFSSVRSVCDLCDELTRDRGVGPSPRRSGAARRGRDRRPAGCDRPGCARARPPSRPVRARAHRRGRASSSARWVFCSTSRMLCPVSRLRPAIRANTSFDSRGLKPSEGSSSISTLGRASRPRPIASICCSPPDSTDAGWCRRAARLRKALVDVGDLGGDRLLIAPVERAHQQVLVDGERHHDAAAFRHQHQAAAHARAGRPVRDVAAVEDHLSAGRLGQSQQRRAAATTCRRRWRRAPRRSRPRRASARRRGPRARGRSGRRDHALRAAPGGSIGAATGAPR